ncbi:hypothetical protein ACOCEA_03365 [Maribacter sp. CXY002]|uniref:hypothetical protein n=1 Tax=Maribacter luteocoastalis TaxID=3407671 RepID=UPI003B680498
MSKKNSINIAKTKRELNNLNTVTQKLEHLRTKLDNLTEEDYSQNMFSLVEAMPKKHFPDKDRNVEFTFWFLEYKAKNKLKQYKLSKEYKDKYVHGKVEFNAKEEIEVIEDEENKARLMIKNHNINWTLKYKPSDNSLLYLLDKKVTYIETVRVLNNYYAHHVSEHSYDTGSPEVKAFYRHIILKEHLQKLAANGKFQNQLYLQPKTFEEMFINPEIIQNCISVLKEVEILNEKEKYVGRDKAAFCIWVKWLKSKSLVHHYIKDETFAKLISKKFHPFTISTSLFRKPNPRAEEKYNLEIQALLSKVSQLSHGLI